ncbi:hypothetical protein BO99DRAFT_437872 [Aspergillus violaceofuscus CBS 115571]|uniref:Uncharacterized protein n=1 Tax=Aspergillus violaceofuscus (strain CBS 115571) TaxID=1450538 RepID=A0A2V5HPJ8_ASPV1|nr:hypothetical protein BO99DRAFT_437872 [Aspergillus violaceofuscus CBS 115571]
MFFATVAAYGHVCKQGDVKQAFLCGKFRDNEKLYMTLPNGFEHGTDKSASCSCLSTASSSLRETEGSAKSAPQFSKCCMEGDAELPPVRTPPAFLRDLLARTDIDGPQFLASIRPYNGALCFTSANYHIDRLVTGGITPPTSRKRANDEEWGATRFVELPPAAWFAGRSAAASAAVPGLPG